MEVLGSPPLSVSSLTWRRTNGRMMLTVVAKTSYRLRSGECELSEVAQPIRTSDRYGSDAASRTLIEPSDLVPHKARADVILVGSAHAPTAPVASLKVRLALGPIDKVIEVFGDRIFGQDGSMRDPLKFRRMPLGYERAAVGSDGWNPAGIRSDVIDALGRAQLPNLQPPGLYVTEASAMIPPISLGAIAPWWPARRPLWTAPGEPALDRLRDEPIVDRVDKSFFNAAPLDQQTDAIRPLERLLLEHMNPEHPVLVTSLPNVRPRAILEPLQREVALVGDTLFIDVDRQVCSVTWRGQLDLSEVDPASRVRVFAERDGQPVDPQFFDEATSDEVPLATTRGDVSKRTSNKTLPFQRQLAGLPLREAPKPPGSPSSQGHPPEWAREPARFGAAGQANPPLWFEARPASAAQPPPASSPATITAEATPAIVASVVRPAQAPPPAQQPAYVSAAATVYGPTGAPIPAAYPPVTAKPADVRPAVGHAASASASAEAASNAAAKSEVKSSATEDASPRVVEGTVKSPVDLVWFDPKALKRVRIFYKTMLTDLAFDEFDSKHEVPSDDPDVDKGRNEVSHVLTREPANDPAAARKILDEAIDDQGRFTPPLAVFESDLRLLFTDAARLEALCALAQPLATTDKRMKELCEQAAEAQKRPMASAGSTLGRLCTQLREHFMATQPRGAQAVNLDPEVERMLLETRSFDIRTVLGGKHLRATLGVGQSAVPAYLPDAVQDHLPLMELFRARIVAEVHVRQDRAEPSSLALRVVALGRVFTSDGSRN